MIEIDARLVKQLVRTQFPQWADLAVTPVENGGWDNSTFRLGERMSVRLPSALAYVAQVEREQRWLPVLGRHLPWPIPLPVGLGAPGAGYPWPWSIYRWLDGEPAQLDRIDDLNRFAADLARFLVALRGIDASGGPAAGPHNFHRGGSLSIYDGETRRSIIALASEIDVTEVTEIWDTALATSWQRPPVWVHGDMAASNLLLKGGALHAVIDFGSAGIGDPASDLVIAWTLLDRAARKSFRAAVALDPATWQRARGWAIWKAMITLLQLRDTSPVEAEEQRRIIREVLDDHAGANEAGE